MGYRKKSISEDRLCTGSISDCDAYGFDVIDERDFCSVTGNLCRKRRKDLF